MKAYELLFFVAPNTDEETRAGVMKRIDVAITAEGGVVDSVEDWGKRRLAYPIEDQTEGVYTLVRFESKPDFPAELDRVFKITEGVLRSMTLAVEE